MKANIYEAMFQVSLPANPRPFLNELVEYVNQNGTRSIKDDKAKQLVWVINALAYGDMETIDQSDEWQRLYRKELDQQ